jgi:HEAT repeat protein
VRDGTALHVSLYVETTAPDPRAALEISPSKVNAVLADYEARLKAAPVARRPAVVREIAGLPQKRATQHLLSHLDDPDARVRAAVIEALGRRGDADAVKPLLAIFKEARRDAATFAASTEALARLGHEDAITPFLEVLEGKDAQAGSVVAERVATLLLQQKKQQSLERAIGRMIDALEMVTDRVSLSGSPVDVGYHSTLSAALRSTTGQPFVAAVDYRNWWNDPLNRKKFLEERQK